MSGTCTTASGRRGSLPEIRCGFSFVAGLPEVSAWPFVGLMVAYLLGSTPFAWIAGRLRGIDLRDHGSGNLGATNVYRVLGGVAACVVLALDGLKGAVPVLWFAQLAGVALHPWWAVGFGLAAVLGHIKPYFGMFRGGGKGVATAAGMFAALAFMPFLVSFGVFVLTVAATRMVSLGSLLGALGLTVASVVQYGPRSHVAVLSVVVALLVLWTHRANIARMRSGTEARLGRPGAQRRAS